MSHLLAWRKNREERPSLLELANDPTGRTEVCDLERGIVFKMKEESEFIEAAGMFNGGKDKHIHSVVAYLRSVGKAVEIFKPNAMIKLLDTKDHGRSDGDLMRDIENRARFDSRITYKNGEVMEGLLSDPREATGFEVVYLDYAFFNRGPYDGVKFSQVLQEFGLIPRSVMERNVAISSYLEGYVGQVLGFHIPVEESLAREGKDDGNVMYREFLEAIHPHYHGWALEAAQFGKPLRMRANFVGIDGTEDFEKNQEKIRDAILSLAPRRVRESYADTYLQYN